MAKEERIKLLEGCQSLVNSQAVCRGYLHGKILAGLQCTAPALKIQTWYRRHVVCQKIESLIPLVQKCTEEKRLVSATISIQKKFSATVLMRAEREHFLQNKSAAVVIQRRLWAMLLVKKQSDWYQQQRSAAVVIQNKFRATVRMRSERQHFLEIEMVAALIQPSQKLYGPRRYSVCLGIFVQEGK
jgi:hypothetical protein